MTSSVLDCCVVHLCSARYRIVRDAKTWCKVHGTTSLHIMMSFLIGDRMDDIIATLLQHLFV